MAQRDVLKAAIDSAIDSAIIDNTSEAITPAVLRGNLKDTFHQVIDGTLSTDDVPAIAIGIDAYTIPYYRPYAATDTEAIQNALMTLQDYGRPFMLDGLGYEYTISETIVLPQGGGICNARFKLDGSFPGGDPIFSCGQTSETIMALSAIVNRGDFQITVGTGAAANGDAGKICKLETNSSIIGSSIRSGELMQLTHGLDPYMRFKEGVEFNYPDITASNTRVRVFDVMAMDNHIKDVYAFCDSGAGQSASFFRIERGRGIRISNVVTTGFTEGDYILIDSYDCTFDNCTMNSYEEAGTGISVYGASYLCTIKNCYFSQKENGINITSQIGVSKRLKIIGNRFVDCVRAIRGDESALDVRIEGNFFDQGYYSFFDSQIVLICFRPVIRNNVFRCNSAGCLNLGIGADATFGIPIEFDIQNNIFENGNAVDPTFVTLGSWVGLNVNKLLIAGNQFKGQAARWADWFSEDAGGVLDVCIKNNYGEGATRGFRIHNDLEQAAVAKVEISNNVLTGTGTGEAVDVSGFGNLFILFIGNMIDGFSDNAFKVHSVGGNEGKLIGNMYRSSGTNDLDTDIIWVTYE